MSREVLDESVSAVMDGEADELELRRVLAATDEDPLLRARWARYQLARDVLHRQAVLPKLDLAAAVSAAIADEDAAAPAPRSARSWRHLGRFAVAASVTLAVLAGMRFYNTQGDGVVAPQLAEQSVPVQPQQHLAPLAAAPADAQLVGFPGDAAPAKPVEPAPVDDLIRSLPPQPAGGAAGAGR